MKHVMVDANGVQVLFDSGDDGPVLAWLASDSLLLSRLMLQESSAAARLDEARMRVIDLAARPIEDLHIVIGDALEDGSSWVGWIERERMAEATQQLRAAGMDAHSLIPLPLLLPEATPGKAGFARLGSQLLFRSDDLAGLAEAELLAALPDAQVPDNWAELPEFRPAPDIGADVPLDLLQGEFAPRIRWWRSRRIQLMAGALAALALLFWALPGLMEKQQQSRMITAMDAAVLDLARQQQLSAETPVEAATQLTRTRQTSEGAALGARLTFIAEAIEAVPGSHIEDMDLGPDGQLKLRLGGPADAINQLIAWLQSGPFAISAHGTELHMAGRDADAPDQLSPLLQSRLRLVNAQRDLAIMQLLQGSAASGQEADPLQAIREAGLDEAQTRIRNGRQQIRIPATRSQTLLPLLVRLEQSGLHIESLSIRRNADATLAVRLDYQP